MKFSSKMKIFATVFIILSIIISFAITVIAENTTISSDDEDIYTETEFQSETEHVDNTTFDSNQKAGLILLPIITVVGSIEGIYELKKRNKQKGK